MIFKKTDGDYSLFKTFYKTPVKTWKINIRIKQQTNIQTIEIA